MKMTKLSPKSFRVLCDIVAGRGTHHQCHGLSEAGGRTTILWSLRKRGLIDGDYQATDAGRELVEKGTALKEGRA